MLHFGLLNNAAVVPGTRFDVQHALRFLPYSWKAIMFCRCSFFSLFFERRPRRSPNGTQQNFATCSEMSQILSNGSSKFRAFPLKQGSQNACFYDDIAMYKREYRHMFGAKQVVDKWKKIPIHLATV